MRPSLLLTPLTLFLATSHAQLDSLISDISSLASSVVSAVGSETTNAALLTSIASDIVSAEGSLTSDASLASQYSSLVGGLSSQFTSVTGSLGNAATSATAGLGGSTPTGSSGDSGNAGERIIPGSMVALGAVVGVAVLL